MALRHYLAKRSEYTKNLIAQHHADKNNMFEHGYHFMESGGDLVRIWLLDNGATYSMVVLDFCHLLNNTPIAQKHGYLAQLTTRLVAEAATHDELMTIAEKLAQEDFDVQAGVLLHEIGHVNNQDFHYRKMIKRVLPPVTAALGATALALSQTRVRPLVSIGLCATGLLATALTMPIAALQSRGHSCLAVWLNAYAGEYRADSYMLKHATLTQLEQDRLCCDKIKDIAADDIDPLDVHPSTSSRIKRIEKQIKKLKRS